MGNFQFDMMGDDMSKIKNNTIIGGGDDDQFDQQEILRNMLQKNMINLPG